MRDRDRFGSDEPAKCAGALSDRRASVDEAMGTSIAEPPSFHFALLLLYGRAGMGQLKASVEQTVSNRKDTLEEAHGWRGQ